jgi:hypothetical protein
LILHLRFGNCSYGDEVSDEMLNIETIEAFEEGQLLLPDFVDDEVRLTSLRDCFIECATALQEQYYEEGLSVP